MASPGNPGRLYDTIDDVEYPGRYAVGGYHPVKLGDLADGRYEVVHKLGYGSYSTVWLSRDSDTQQLVAVKIAVASAAEESRARRESEIRRQLGLVAASHPWGKYVQQLLYTFVETGPNGAHQCLVSEPAGGSLADSKELSNYICLFPLEVSRAICAQMIQATAFIHSQGIVHGDLHLGNILIASLREATRPPERIPVKRRDGAPLEAGVPPYVVFPGAFCPPSHKMPLADAHIVLSDFGEAWAPASEDRFQLHTAHNYRSPDAVLDPLRRPLGAASDIWALALALCVVYGKRDVLHPWESPDRMVVAAVQALGRPPQALWAAWAARGTFFDDAGAPKPKMRAGGAPYPLRESVLDVRLDREDAVADFPDDPPFGDDEMQDVLDMLLSMLRWAADDRVSASELAEGTWMQTVFSGSLCDC